MVGINDFTISQSENGKFVVIGKGYYQDIDFEHGGFILTRQRAEEIRDLLIEQQNTPNEIPITPEERINILEEQNAANLLEMANRDIRIEVLEEESAMQLLTIAELQTKVGGTN